MRFSRHSIPTGVWLAAGALACSLACSCSKEPETQASAPGNPATSGPGPQAAARSARLLTDDQIDQGVVDQFERDPGIDAKQISVTTKNGIVELTGTVNDILSKERVARVAETVRGVRSVDNRLDLYLPQRDDQDIDHDVSTALLLNAATDSLDIHGDSNHGTVTLTGNAQSWQEKQLAERLVKGVTGVRAVDDQIAVKYATERGDTDIKDDVQSRLHWDALLSEDPITVSVGGGNVYLTGEVGSAAERSRAYADSWVANVSSVDVSGIVVNPARRDTALRSAGPARRSDVDIAQAIEDSAAYDPRVKSFEIRPEVKGGVVTLFGIVDNLQAKLAAESLARNTVGVVEVRNRIQVTTDVPQTDQARAERIESALAINRATSPGTFHVVVDDGTATLGGAVDNFYEAARAAEIAGTVSGVTHVDNQLTVRHPAKGFVYLDYVAPYEPYVESWVYYPGRTPKHSDSEIAKSIRKELATSPFVKASSIDVRVHHGTATLTGKVNGWGQRSAATEDALQGGAIAVNNELQVK